jgi:hypothetical protein
MKTAVILITAIIVPGGLFVLAMAGLYQLMAQWRVRRHDPKPVLTGPLIP